MVANLCTEQLRTRASVLYRTNQLRKCCTIYQIQQFFFVKEELYK